MKKSKHTTKIISQSSKPDANGAQPVGNKPANKQLSGGDSQPLRQDVARQAYFNYLEQGCQEGHDVEHWLDAETQLAAKSN